MSKNQRSILYAAIAVLSWSTVATMFKVSLKYFSHFEMLVVASFTALFIFAIAMTLIKKWSTLKSLSHKQWVKFSLIGALNPVAYYLVLFKAYDLLPAQVAQPINYAWPIVLLVLLAFITKQSIPKIKYWGMAISLGGVALISLGTGGLSGETLSVLGLGLAFLSAFLWAIYWIVNRQNSGIDNITALFLSFLFGSIYLGIGALIVGVDLSNTTGLWSSVYVGAFEMGIPFIFFGLALRTTDNPVLANQMCYLSPFLSLFFIHMVLGEQIYLTTFIGLILIVLGIIFNEYLTKYFKRISPK